MGAISILLLALLLAFPAVSIEGASNGLLLWYQVVLPALAPFMICTQLVTALGGVELLMKPFFPLLHRIFGLSLPGAYVMLCGLLCGYPLGAKLCADFSREGRISRQEASYLLAICNHPSPMFLLGYVRGQLPVSVPAFLLFICLYLPVLPLSLLAGTYYGFPAGRGSSDGTSGPLSQEPHHIRTETGKRTAASGRKSLEEIIASTCETMVLIGGYIMLFSIIAAWVNHLRAVPAPAKALLTGLAEITSGVHQICILLPEQEALLFVIASVSFGGLSGIFQTKSVIKKSSGYDCAFVNETPTPEHERSGRYTGLSIRHYVIWKALHAALSSLILILLSQFLPR